MLASLRSCLHPRAVCAGQALAGEVGMSNELDDVARSLFNGMIPGIWKRLAPDTLKSLANWMLHFQRRFEQYRFWVSTASGFSTVSSC